MGTKAETPWLIKLPYWYGYNKATMEVTCSPVGEKPVPVIFANRNEIESVLPRFGNGFDAVELPTYQDLVNYLEFLAKTDSEVGLVENGKMRVMAISAIIVVISLAADG